MARTAQFQLPLVAAAQAQKHVTVNEALTRLDAAAQLRVLSSEVATPPSGAVDGASYLIPSGALGEWVGKTGFIAIWSNGGWVYLAPKAGWTLWDESRQGVQMHDGTGWVADAAAVSANGAGMLWKIHEFEHAITAGASNLTAVSIPKNAQVIGITGRVADALTGVGLSTWRIGTGGSDNRYGSGLGLARNSYLVGLTGSPVTYYADTPLLITAEGGTFDGGRVLLALTTIQLVPPRAV